jgi:adenine-specific DNA glycosylase
LSLLPALLLTTWQSTIMPNGSQLRQIPGVGPYTAAAVASIAFNDRAAAVDGNVIRVCARLRALRGNPTKMSKVWDKLAGQLLHPERPGCHNQVCSRACSTVGVWLGRAFVFFSASVRECCAVVYV